ncbi:MAG: hypothetical protein HY006_00140 [Candidatus Sungbacteria bacterium]|nr:hypothetical protein [Candidatus Sungbacteria bacterium]
MEEQTYMADEVKQRDSEANEEGIASSDNEGLPPHFFVNPMEGMTPAEVEEELKRLATALKESAATSPDSSVSEQKTTATA